MATLPPRQPDSPDPEQTESPYSAIETEASTSRNVHKDKANPTRTNDETEGAGLVNDNDNDNDNDDDDDDDHDDEHDDTVPRRQKPSRLAGLIDKLGLNMPTVVTMFKGSLPPTIGIAMYQATPVAAYFTTLGYLLPIVSVLALAILPRGKFLMNLFLNIIAIGLGAAVGMLAVWSGVKAREHTTPGGTRPSQLATAPYNSSQSAVCALWLFAGIWFANVARAYRPALNLPVTIFSIFVNVAATYGPFMTTTSIATFFIQELASAMLVAMALATGVNLLVIPISSRLVVFREFTGAIGLLRRTVFLQKAYLVSLESDDMFAVATRTNTTPQDDSGKKPKLTKEQKAARALQGAGDKLRELAGKLQADIPFAKRDFAWGKLDAKDISELFKLIRNVYVPVLGMMTIIDIFKRVSEHRGWDLEDEPEEFLAEKEKEKRVWNHVMKQMHEPFEILSEAIDQGLEHAGICLELLPRPITKGSVRNAKSASNPSDVDVEQRGEEVRPGDAGLSKIIAEKVEAFYSRKGELLRSWVEERRFNFDEEDDDEGHDTYVSPTQRERDQAQLYIVLYMENLMHASGQAVLDLVTFADKKVEDGTMAKSRLILPSFSRLRKWFVGMFQSENSSAEQSPDFSETNNTFVYFGDGYSQKRDPEHLPPSTAWERFGNALRRVSNFFGSEESAFGFRVACATMTVGIIAYLENTQRFFMEQRLVWAMIIIAIGMTMTSGQSFFGFLCRVGGTLIAMCLSLIIWYIVDGHTAGAIVFLWVSVGICYYFLVKFPRFIPAVMITIVTQVLIIGYELQTLKIGREVAERTGQPWYPTYLLAPYRLATVAAGSLIAFFWTIFPSPITDRTWLRRDLSATLYLVANYFGIISSTLQSNLDGTAGDIATPGTPAHQLHKFARKIFGKVMMLIPSMKQHSEWQRWEPTIGGKFPRAAYDDIILRSTRIMAYLTLISYTLMHHPNLPPGESSEQTAHGRSGRHSLASQHPSITSHNREWLDALAKVLKTLKPTHHTILSTLTLLSNSLLSGQSLPPFLPLPRPYEMTRRLMRLGRVKSRRHRDGDYDGRNYEDEDSELAEIRMVDSRTGLEDDEEDTWRRQSRNDDDADQLATLLDPRNMEQPGYAEFAVLQVCTTLVCDDLEGLVKAVSGLVGVVDFSFRQGANDSTVGNEKGKGKVD
ncbi:hypothetical protein QBC35DRAFT_474804 [Podospora australis]|uniref:ER transporter 6TM N-terminal domain-containing protein n=1 Tax=Podospora australis TaxID=1536484 RepID=A0AAN6WTK7_9PEZI|nr:hypothetical protein QBC35DRAFT_474804 [Podospora australis]